MITVFRAEYTGKSDETDADDAVIMAFELFVHRLQQLRRQQ